MASGNMYLTWQVLTLIIVIAFILLELQSIYHLGALYITDSWNYWFAPSLLHIALRPRTSMVS